MGRIPSHRHSRSRRRGHSGCEHCAAFPNAGGYACGEHILDRGFRISGCFLLAELLNRTQATVYCLVRSSTNEDGMARIRAKLKSYDLWDAATSARIVAVPGDLSKPLLGLSVKQFEMMADVVDAVYHSAAIVHRRLFVRPYQGCNVLGTQEIIRMACRGRRKVLHHISTISVFPPLLDADEVGPVTEDALFERWQNLSTGYAQSKWVAEKLCGWRVLAGSP